MKDKKTIESMRAFLAILLCCFFAVNADTNTEQVANTKQVKNTEQVKNAEQVIDSNNEDLSTELSEQGKEQDFISSDMFPYLVEFQEEGSIQAYWKVAFKPKAFYNRTTVNTNISAEIYGKVRWELVEDLSFHTQILVLGRNGFTQSIYDRDDRVRGLNLLEGFFEWEASSDLSLKIGNIQQNFLIAPLLISDRTFPSVMGELSLANNDQLSLLFRVAIPDNSSESVQRETQIIKGVPLFLISSLMFHSSDFLFDSSVRETFSLFHYYNLSPAVADKSRIYGNTIKRTGSDSTFAYPYLGLHNNISVQKLLSKFWIIELGLEFVYNFLAPDTKNEGMRIYSSLYHNYNNFMELKLIGELFANQSDSSVAYYNSETYGHNNRKGFLTKLQSHFYNSGITVGADFVYSDPINDPDKSPIGSAFSFSVFLKTNYVSI